MLNVADLRFFLLCSVLVLMCGCGKPAAWTRQQIISPPMLPVSASSVEATIESVAFLSGIQRGLNLRLDENVQTDQGVTNYIFLEQPTELPTGVIMMKRVRVHFDAAGSPLYVERVEPARAL